MAAKPVAMSNERGTVSCWYVMTSFTTSTAPFQSSVLLVSPTHTRWNYWRSQVPKRHVPHCSVGTVSSFNSSLTVQRFINKSVHFLNVATLPAVSGVFDQQRSDLALALQLLSAPSGVLMVFRNALTSLQGGVSSPYLFAVYTVYKVKSYGFGCYIKYVCVSVFFICGRCFTKFEHNTSISVAMKTFGTKFWKFTVRGRFFKKNAKISL